MEKLNIADMSHVADIRSWSKNEVIKEDGEVLVKPGVKAQFDMWVKGQIEALWKAVEELKAPAQDGTDA